MMDEARAAGETAKRPPPLEDIEATDEMVAEALIRELPDALRVAFAQAMRSMVLAAIGRERKRCAMRIDGGAHFHVQRIAEIENAIVRAIGNGDERTAVQLGSSRFLENDRMQTLRAIRRAVELAPGACTNCGGSAIVPTAVALPDGSLGTAPCPVCQPQPPVQEATS